MKLQYPSILVLVVALLIGCSPKVEAPPKSSGSGDAAAAPDKPGVSSADSAEPTVSLAAVPQSARTDAFDYYGLGSTGAMDVEMKTPDQPARTGSVSFKFDKIDGDKAHFKVSRTGAVAEILGDNEGYADASGVYMTGTSIGTITPDKFLALPSNLTPGKTWNLKNKISANNGQTIAEDSVYKVQGERDVKTKAGVQKALLVTSTGSATQTSGGTTIKHKYETKSWYVKGEGPVRF